MMNETCNAYAPQEAPGHSLRYRRERKNDRACHARVEGILHKLRGEKSVCPTEGCVAEQPPTFGALRQLTESQQRQLNRLLNRIEELDSLI